MMKIVRILLIFTQFLCYYGLEVLNLGGDRWILSDETGNYRNLSATVPGGVYTDLIRNKIIGDVFYGYNDTATRWVAKNNWTYSLYFDVDHSIMSHENIKITFDGLDTFSRISLNGLEIGRSRNMFVRYSFDVGKIIKFGGNLLEVDFTSPIIVGANLTSKQNYEILPTCPPGAYNGECHVNQMRKMQSSFSWDWGPALPSMGIWKNVKLEAYNSTIIRDVLVKAVPDGDAYRIQVKIYVDSNERGRITGKFLYKFYTETTVVDEVVAIDRNTTSKETEIAYGVTIISKYMFRKWWPNGYGDQPLYNVTVTFVTDTEIHSKTVRIGFRKVELIQDKTQSGLNFYFKVNDIAIFAKGANEIPVNILPELGQNPENVRNLLESVKLANMNMLRVWGGGVYESDYFYDLADEFGILIWQDFMFACSMYPTYTDFLNNVIVEVHQQFKRLSSHPSIILWAGNNENEAALMGNWYGTQSNFDQYKSDYIKLYVKTIRKEVLSMDNETIFLTSSPTNGKQSELEGYLSKSPQSEFYGDVHFYNYVFNSLQVSIYPIPRFASEYGYQSLPNIDSWLTTTNDIKNLDANSSFMEHRQHHPGGNLENDVLIAYQLPIPEEPARYFYYSQILQALSIKCETEYYRSFQGRYTSDGKGNTMGALFWQLNDVWIAPTWSGIDFLGRWKMLHYYAKDFFAPTVIIGYLNIERQLEVYAISDIMSLIDSEIDTTAIITVYNWNCTQPVNRREIDLKLEYGRSIQVTQFDTDVLLNSLNCGSLSEARKNCFFHLILKVSNTIITPPNFVLVDSLKNSNLQIVNVTITTVKQLNENGDKFEIGLKTDGIALFVWLESHKINGRFSDNGFIQVEPLKIVQFYAKQRTTVQELEQVLTVMYLNDESFRK